MTSDRVQPKTNIYAIFHMNLAFSSIEIESHAKVINKCYWPILNLVESGYPIALEMTAYTLEAISAIAPEWVAKFKQLLKSNQCQLIASGDSQIIGPLIPTEVNKNNLRIGLNSYKNILDVSPKIAYVNEQAISAGLLDIYLDAGFEAVVVEWDNPYSHSEDWTNKDFFKPQQLKTASGRSIKVVWNNAIAFQKFQRYAHSETVLEDYLGYLEKTTSMGMLAFPIYGSDAEVFDYRPGRYNTESAKISQEWKRISELFDHLSKNQRYHWCHPSELLALASNEEPLHITNAAHPVSVKKQAKYNITRWGLSGRNDLQLNTYCNSRYEYLIKNTIDDDEQWRALCRLWSSDYRTHLTELRYQKITVPPQKRLDRLAKLKDPAAEGTDVIFDRNRKRVSINTGNLQLVLNAGRGLVIESLAFASNNFIPVVGTLSHGHFDHISYGADFYSNHMLMERFKQRDRITDLNPINYEISHEGSETLIQCRQDLSIGTVVKYYRIIGESVTTGFIFNNQERPEASLRLGFITLLNCDSRCWYQTHLGSDHFERFNSTTDFDHGQPVSSIVSANGALGATQGKIAFGNDQSGVLLDWRPSQCAALPMLTSKRVGNLFFNRLWFSLIEADETLKAGGELCDFEFTIRPFSMESENT
ncbi:glycoside hydrolase [Shewanella waksmanii]|uniref:glycoside hydrolase n=1 Tax=Shewanella waksmanii TaxID=213783 RepID=UPI000491EC47|nr:glycoside hydrolase [Shewanella waksmanii]